MKYSVTGTDGVDTWRIGNGYRTKREAIAVAKRQAKRLDPSVESAAVFEALDRDTGECVATFESAYDAPPPPCRAGTGHRWVDDGNVYGDGGGVRWSEICKRCGCRAHHTTWGSHPVYPWSQGHKRVTYETEERWSAYA